MKFLLPASILLAPTGAFAPHAIPFYTRSQSNGATPALQVASTETDLTPPDTIFYPLYGPRDPNPNTNIPSSVIAAATANEVTGADTIPCPVYTPQDHDPTGYLSAREDCWNLSCKEWPNAIAVPTSPGDVQAIVTSAKGQKVAVLSGGHSPMCMPDGAFLINLRKMNTVLVDKEGMTVTAGGGAKIGEVDAALKPHHLAVPLGTHPDTGIGGLTLGGGIGWLTPRVGLAIDNLVAADVVLADGRLVTASATSYPDLYWAIRGGGGNFGVVVSFTYKVYSVGGADGFAPGMVLGGIVPFPLESFEPATVIEKYGAECLATDADNVQMLLLPNGGPAISVFTHHGTLPVAQAALDHLGTGYGTGLPPKDGVTPITWTDGVQTLTGMGDPNGPGDLLAPGNPFYYTAGFVRDLTPQLSSFLAEAQRDAADRTGIHAGGAIVIMPLNGPYNDVVPDATAISTRDAKFWVVFLLRLEGDEAEKAEGIAWGRTLKKEFMGMEGVVTDMRLNKHGSIVVDEDTHSVLPSQNEGCVEKMRAIKEEYDPRNLFCYASLSK